MYSPIVIALDVIVFLLAVTATVISTLKMNLFSRGSSRSFGWWYILPAILLWTSFVRGLYVLVAIDLIPVYYSPWITASQVVFYVGIVVFLWDFYQTAMEVFHK